MAKEKKQQTYEWDLFIRAIQLLAKADEKIQYEAMKMLVKFGGLPKTDDITLETFKQIIGFMRKRKRISKKVLIEYYNKITKLQIDDQQQSGK